MPINDVEEFRTTVEALAETLLARIEVRDGAYLEDAEGLQTLRILAYALQAVAASIGECRMELPYKPLMPVIDVDGNFKWCCMHDPAHCAP